MVSHAVIRHREMMECEAIMSIPLQLLRSATMTRVHFPQDIAANVQRLLDSRNCPEDVRRLAGDVLDLTALLATWPVPRSLKLDEELKRQFLRLCRLSGGNLCGTQQCVANDGEGGPPAFRIEWASN